MKFLNLKRNNVIQKLSKREGTILELDSLINEISYLSFEDLLELGVKDDLKDIRIRKHNKILTLNLN